MAEGVNGRASSGISKLSVAVPLASALFGAVGFLSARAYLSGLGIPEHAAIPLEGYIQYGGRLFFILAVHLLPVSGLAGIVLMIMIALKRRWLRRIWGTGHFVCLILTTAALVTVVLELVSLEAEPVFSPGRVRGGEVSRQLRFSLYLIEVGATVTIIWLGRWFEDLWRSFQKTLFQKTLLSFGLLLTLIELLLLPLCLGRIAMVPAAFDQVTLCREKDQPNLIGILVFSDASNYFIFSGERKLIEVPHSGVREIQYESSQLLKSISER